MIVALVIGALSAGILLVYAGLLVTVVVVGLCTKDDARRKFAEQALVTLCALGGRATALAAGGGAVASAVAALSP